MIVPAVSFEVSFHSSHDQCDTEERKEFELEHIVMDHAPITRKKKKKRSKKRDRHNRKLQDPPKDKKQQESKGMVS